MPEKIISVKINNDNVELLPFAKQILAKDHKLTRGEHGIEVEVGEDIIEIPYSNILSIRKEKVHEQETSFSDEGTAKKSVNAREVKASRRTKKSNIRQ